MGGRRSWRRGFFFSFFFFKVTRDLECLGNMERLF